jgi:predicted dehydrogenase
MKNSRRRFLKTLGAAALAAPFVTRDLLAAPPGRVIRHASFGCAGMAFSDLTQIAKCPGVEIAALCDVDVNRAVEARKQFPNAKFYRDWRELLEREAKNLDSVNVSVPDHMHAPIALSAMALGKHVYGQKPLAHEINEVRAMVKSARRHRVVTQMGIQIHSSVYYRTGVQVLRDGVIGKIKEVHSWCPKFWGDPAPRPNRTDAVPENFDWNLWLGVAAERPFIGDNYYHPENWRKRLDFGTGTLGDMGCHIFDPIFKALELAAPVSVRSEGPPPNEWNWAVDEKIIYHFAGNRHTAETILPLTWYDGHAAVPEEKFSVLAGAEKPEMGSLFIGTQGALVLPHFELPRLYPAAQFKDYKLPKVAGVNHWAQFVNACRGDGKTSANFDYAGPLTEAILLGGIATRFPQATLDWSAWRMKFKQSEANPFLRRKYRQGWEM